jgi:hypothetical protein
MKLEEYAALTIGAIFKYARQMEMRTPLQYVDVPNAISAIVFIIITGVPFVFGRNGIHYCKNHTTCNTGINLFTIFILEPR